MSTTMKYAGLDLGTIEGTFNLLGGIEGAARFRRGELVLIPKAVCDAALEAVSPIIRVPRLRYPDWVKKVMHPELEFSGPNEYDLQMAVQQWLHDDQKRGSVQGNTIYKHLQKGDALATCLNLQDGLAIQAKGIAVFRKLFAGKAVFLWGSVVQHHSGDLVVPCLVENGGRVVVSWRWLDDDWSSVSPALRFSKN